MKAVLLPSAAVVSTLVFAVRSATVADENETAPGPDHDGLPEGLANQLGVDCE